MPSLKQGATIMKLSDEQQEAIDIVLKGESLLVKGSAGTGKSFLINALVDKLTEKGLPVIKCSPTGKASSLINGWTIDYIFGLPTREPFDPNVNIHRQRWNEPEVRYYKGDVPRGTYAIIIDEISMVRCDKFDAIDASLRLSCKNDRPFGGKVMVLVGDMGQLRPVVAGNDKQKLIDRGYQEPFTIFESNVWKNL